MPIFIDASELRTNTTMPDIPNAQTVPDLEALTGADFMLSILQAPASSETLIKRHIAANALLIQRKHGHDLASSIGTRLNQSLAKMHSIGAKQSQCVLLFIGLMTADAQSNAIINKQNTRKPFMTIQAAISKWHDRGGVYENLPRPTLLTQWCQVRLKHLEEYTTTPIKEIWPPNPELTNYDTFLQIPEPIKDGRIFLAALPGIGAKNATLLYNEFNGDIIEALCWLSIPQFKNKRKRIKGIGKKTFENIRDALGIDSAMWLSVEAMPDPLIQREIKRRGE